MDKIYWRAKLTSRKFWAAIVAVATTLMVIFGVTEPTQSQIIALISSSSVLIAYIIGEGLVDAARINQTPTDTKEE